MKRVLILDDDESLTYLMSLLFTEHGLNCVVTHSLEELESKKGEALVCELAILDINLGFSRPSGLDAYRWLKQQNFPGKIIFFTGHAKTHHLVKEATAIHGIRVIEKPTDVADLLNLVEEL